MRRRQFLGLAPVAAVVACHPVAATALAVTAPKPKPIAAPVEGDVMTSEWFGQITEAVNTLTGATDDPS